MQRKRRYCKRDDPNYLPPNENPERILAALGRSGFITHDCTGYKLRGYYGDVVSNIPDCAFETVVKHCEQVELVGYHYRDKAWVSEYAKLPVLFKNKYGEVVKAIVQTDDTRWNPNIPPWRKSSSIATRSTM